MGLVIDTSALVQMDRGKIEVDDLPFAKEPIVMPTIVWAEALIGVRLASSPERAASRRGLLERIRLMTAFEPFSPEAAELYAELYSQLRNKGAPIPQNDMQIAATALSLGYGVLIGASGEKHFRQISQLRVEVLK